MKGRSPTRAGARTVPARLPEPIFRDFPTRAGAKGDWVINNQLARRNLSEEQKSYLRGKRYIAEKRSPGNPKLQSVQNEQIGLTDERIAKEYGVSGITIRRDADYAEAIDAIAANSGCWLSTSAVDKPTPGRAE